MKKYVSFFLISLFCNQIMFSQFSETKGIHQLDKEAYGNSKNAVNKTVVGNKEIIPIYNRTQTLTKKVFGFLPYWEQSSGANNNIVYNNLTHLACFDFLVNFDASISLPTNWPWTTEINTAHSNGVKVIMTVTNFGGTSGADTVAWELFNNTSKQTTFFNNVKNLIQTYNLDGVNIDFEGMTSSHRGAELNTFMQNLTNFIHTELPGKEVSFDGPAVNWGGWIIDDLVAGVDYVIVMAYNYTSTSGGNSGPVSPLIHYQSSGKSVTKTIETGTYAVPTQNSPEKLILAVPYYGFHWKTQTSAAESSTISYQGSTRFKNTVTEVNTAGYESFWSSNFEYPWYRWYDGVNWHQVWADNELSISKKYDLAIADNLGGVGIWALNYDGNRPELWNLITTKFGNVAAVDDVFKEGNIILYPNPSNRYIKISNPKNLKFSKMEIYNVYGQKIKNINPNTVQIDVDGLPSGLYFLKVENVSKNRGVFKFLKSNGY